MLRASDDSTSSPFASGEVQQYVEEIIYASSEYGPKTSISYNSINVIGRPNNFPAHGDHSNSYLLTSYGNWRMLAPSFTPEFGLSKIPAVDNPPVDDFIIVLFERSVYPTGVEVYETLNPGAIYRIWAYTEHSRWTLLWDKRVDAIRDDVSNTGKSRIFRPVIRTISHLTRVLRIEFSTRDLNYISGIDAIMLKSRLIDMLEPERKKYMHRMDPFTLKSSLLNLIELQPEPEDNPILPQQQLVERERKQLQHQLSITNMPYEMIFKIFSYLDIKSLRNVEKVSATFHDVVRDSRLYREVNMRPYWMEVDSQLLEWLNERCTDIRKLDLSWCGMCGMLTEDDLHSFLMRHGHSLTHLRLNSVEFRYYSDIAITLCPNVNELCLQNMHIREYVHLGVKITTLTKLDLSGAVILSTTLKNILWLNRSLQHLNLSCCKYDSFTIADTIGNCNRDLISLNLFKTRALSADDLVPLANCTKLQELNLGYANHEEVQEGELSRLMEACPDLRKLVLAGFRDVHNNDMLTIAQHCPALEYLDLMGCITVTGESVNAIFIGCSAFRFLEINHCNEISNEWITEWKNRYPQVAIKHQEY